MHKILLAMLAAWTLPARTQEDPYRLEAHGYLRTPMVTRAGVVCTDNFGSSVYIVQNGTLTPLHSSPGVGRGMQVSPDGRVIGVKLIDAQGYQVPALLEPGSGDVTLLAEPREVVGQVSFARNGALAFTLGDTLVVMNAGTESRFDLGGYVNTAPLSPDARYAVFNDASDQLWLLSLSDGTRRRITGGSKGYCMPVWSPDASRIAFTSLDGDLAVYDREHGRITPLGTGSSPAWSPDGQTLVFSRTIMQIGHTLTSDLYVVNRDGTDMRALVTTPEVHEMEPVFSPDGGDLLYHTAGRREILRRRLPGDGSLAGAPQVVVVASAGMIVRPRTPRLTPPASLDIPYLNQVYDTPDWFNGHWACAPTQAMMVLAYYHVLPPWDLTCTWPYRHVTPWGRYVAERYRFRQTDYQSQAEDPNGTPAAGGFGYMWSGTFSPHTRMAAYYRNHGLAATQTEGTPYDVARAEIDSARPFSMCVLLTSSGHLVLAHGVGTHPRTLIFHDPYGDKNQGYMNYDGKNVQYDWPGYNNGYQNLNQVAWCIAATAPSVPEADTLVDDLQFHSGFHLHNAPPSSMLVWKDINRGYNGHLWYTSTRGPGFDTAYAVWTPRIPADGIYDVEAFVSVSNANDARYRVMSMDGEAVVSVNQKTFSEAWALLGTFPFLREGPAYVRLGDASSIAGQEIVFDAMRWRFRGGLTSVGMQEIPGGFALSQNFPNPFNPTTEIRYEVPVRAEVRIAVADLLGREVAVLVNEPQAPGRYTARFDASGLAGGVYFCRLISGLYTLTRTMLLVK